MKTIHVEYSYNAVILVLSGHISRKDLLTIHAVLSEFVDQQKANIVVDVSNVVHAHYLIADLILSKYDIAKQLGCKFSIHIGNNRWIEHLLEVRMSAESMIDFRSEMYE